MYITAREAKAWSRMLRKLGYVQKQAFSVQLRDYLNSMAEIVKSSERHSLGRKG